MPRSHHCAFLFPDVVESCSAVKWQEYSTQRLPNQDMCCLTAMRGKQYCKISAVRLLVAVLVRCMLCTACCFLFSSLVIKNITKLQIQQLQLPYLWCLQPLGSHRCSYGALELRRLFEALPVPGPLPHKDLQDLDQHRPWGSHNCTVNEGLALASMTMFRKSMVGVPEHGALYKRLARQLRIPCAIMLVV